MRLLIRVSPRTGEGLSGSDTQLRFQDVVDGLGVGFAAGGFHDLADEPPEGLRLVLHLGDLFGVGGDDLVHDLFDGAGVGDLFEAVRLDDGGGFALACEHPHKDILGDLAADRVVGDQRDETAEGGRGDRAFGKLEAFLVEVAEEFLRDPVGGAFGIAALGDDFELLCRLEVGCQNARVLAREAILLFEPRAPLVGSPVQPCADFLDPAPIPLLLLYPPIPSPPSS